MERPRFPGKAQSLQRGLHLRNQTREPLLMAGLTGHCFGEPNPEYARHAKIGEDPEAADFHQKRGTSGYRRGKGLPDRLHLRFLDISQKFDRQMHRVRSHPLETGTR